MTEVLLVIHVIIAIALVAVILLQRSEGGALGIGGGGGGLMSSRGAGNALTRATAILAACFFATSIGLTVVQSVDTSDGSIIEQIEQQEQQQAPAIEEDLPSVPLSD